METNNEIEVVLESANGPKIVYAQDADGDEVDAAAPEGWRVDWETTPADCGVGRKASPLCRVVTSFTLTMLDGSGVTQTIQAADLVAARVAAREWVEGGDYHSGEDGESTIWEDVRIEWIDEDGDECEDEVRNIAIDPPTPKCLRGKEHDWQTPHEIVGGLKENPGVWGSGGGVKGTYVCLHCGCGKHWDSWAQRRDNGEQWLASVSYVRGEYAEQLESLASNECES